MKRLCFFWGILFIAVIAVSIFVHTHCSNEAIITAAASYAKQSGYKIENYSITVNKTNGVEITVLFFGKEMRPGNFFLVFVNSNTMECRISHGL
jgi:hypothetical protein